MVRSSLYKKWRTLSRRARWALTAVAAGAVHFLVSEILRWLKPHLPLWWEGVVSALQDLLGVVPTSWFLVFAAGLAFPVVWDLVTSRGEAIAGYGRALRARLPLGATITADSTEPFRLSCKVREAEQLPKGSPLTKWVGIVVNPNVDLLDCEVRMVAIWRNGECLYDEPLNCIWSNSARDTKRTIRAGIQETAALCMAEAGKPGLYATTSILKPKIAREMRKPESALYRVDVAVHATNSRVKRQWFVVEYGGDFDHIEIRPETT